MKWIIDCRQHKVKIYENYMESIHMSRAAHDMVTIFGGKVPHNHGILAGGGTVLLLVIMRMFCHYYLGT